MSFSYARTSPPVKKVFSQYEDDFYLCTEGYLKLKDIPKDVQAVIDSSFDTRLEAILDMYSDVIASMNGYAVEFSDDVVDIDHKKSALDQILAVDQMLADYQAADPALAGLKRDQLVKKLQSSYDEAVRTYQNKLKGDQNNVEEKEAEPEGK